MARVVICGCGYVGTALGEELAASGDTVWGLRRDPSSLPPSILPLAADLLDPRSLAAVLPRGADALVYAASASGYSDDAYRRAYVDGVASLLEALEALGERPGRVVFTSSTGVYGEDLGRWVDENTPPGPGGFNGARVLEGEELFRASGLPSVSLRLGGIYGPGRTRLVQMVIRGEARCTGASSWTNRIHRDDCAGALAHLLRLPRPQPVYVGVDREPSDLCTVFRWIAGRLGLPDPPVDSGAERRGAGKRCSSRRLVESGYTFRYPTFREGFGSLLPEVGAGGGG